MSQIFLSYAAVDRPRTRRLIEALEAQGWSVWWDRTITPGRTFDSVIEEALSKAGCVIVLWSEASIASEWVKTEAEEARQRGILVPVLIDDVRVPFEFRRIQAARLVEWDGSQTHQEFQQLLQAVAATIGQDVREPRTRPVPPPPPPPRAPHPETRASRVRLAILGGAIGVGLALSVAGYQLLSAWRQPLVIGVMEIHPRGSSVSTWMCDFTRDGLNTVLSKTGRVRVLAKQKIDLLREKRGLSEIEAAEMLGIGKMISGTLSTTEDGMTLEVEVVDIKTGMLDDSARTRGSQAQLVEMQNKAAVDVLDILKVGVDRKDLDRIVAQRTNDQLQSYKLLTESMGGFDDGEPPAPAPKSGGPHTSWTFPFPTEAHAGDGAEEAVHALLEQYRTALEAKDVDKIAGVYLQMTDGIRDGLQRYFAAAENLHVKFSNFDILIEGDTGVATFTRNDEFRDVQSGHDQRLEVRVSSVVAKQDGTWKIRGLRKPS